MKSRTSWAASQAFFLGPRAFPDIGSSFYHGPLHGLRPCHGGEAHMSQRSSELSHTPSRVSHGDEARGRFQRNYSPNSSPQGQIRQKTLGSTAVKLEEGCGKMEVCCPLGSRFPPGQDHVVVVSAHHFPHVK